VTTNRRKFEKRLMAFINKLRDEGYSPGYIENYLKAVRSWAEYHEVILRKKYKVGNRNITPTLEDEVVPTPQQVLDIRSSASARGRICIGAVAYGGLRPEVLGHARYRDGLKLEDLPELDIEKIKFEKVPTLVEVRHELSKVGHRYRTFFPEPLCIDIVRYLERRQKKGEELSGSSPLVTVHSSQKSKGRRTVEDNGHIVTALISRDIRRAMRPKYTWRPLVLRSFFQSQLLLAVSNGILENRYLTYWMGHKGSMSARYSTNKNLLPQDLIEDMRSAYERSQKFLLGEFHSIDEIRKMTVMDLLTLAGDDSLRQEARQAFEKSNVDEAIEEISRWGLRIIRTDQRKFREELNVPPNSGKLIVVTGNKNLEKYLEQGWTYLRKLEPKPAKEYVGEQILVTPDGKVYAGENKIVAVMGEDGTFEIWGNPDELDELFVKLEKYGVEVQSIEKKTRFLLKKHF